MVVFTSRKIYRSKLSSKIYSNVGLPTLKNFNHRVSINMISKCPISVADISYYENIYGSSMASLKGNSTRNKPRPVVKDYIQISSRIYKNNSNIDLYIDAVYIHGVLFLVSIGRKV